MKSEQVGWPSAVVAVALLAMLTSITVAGIARYEVDDALQVWTAMAALVGVVTGSFVTYFFTRGPINDAKQQATEAQDALKAVAGKLEPKQFNDLVKAEPAIARRFGIR